MVLQPLDNALHFYQTNGYDYRRPGFYLGKKLSKPVAGVIPVFEWCDELNAKLNVNIDNALLKDYKGKPMFVYVGLDNKIDGIALRASNGQEIVKINNSQPKHRGLDLSWALGNVR